VSRVMHYDLKNGTHIINTTRHVLLPYSSIHHPYRGIQVNSDPEARLRALEEENRLLNES